MTQPKRSGRIIRCSHCDSPITSPLGVCTYPLCPLSANVADSSTDGNTITEGILCSKCKSPMVRDAGGALECSDPWCPDPPPDHIHHPPHYTQHPSGVECITITEHYNFNTGNAIKYLWRAGLKDGTDAASDLSKAAWYVRREIERLHRPAGPVIPGTYCSTCDASLTLPFCPDQSCPQSPLYVLATIDPDFPPVEAQAQVAAAYADRYAPQPDADAVTDSIYGDHITDHNANDLPWGSTHNHLNARINALPIHNHSGASHAD